MKLFFRLLEHPAGFVLSLFCLELLVGVSVLWFLVNPLDIDGRLASKLIGGIWTFHLMQLVLRHLFLHFFIFRWSLTSSKKGVFKKVVINIGISILFFCVTTIPLIATLVYPTILVGFAFNTLAEWLSVWIEIIVSSLIIAYLFENKERILSGHPECKKTIK